ncbi:hypothetical protein ACGFZH_37630 [Streptomyces zaomyceticus]|uniref:hypothetical protein n=1 Tax=Streptomyces zaomyceticus TaxID=68286 RepID=UPI003710061A
MTPGRCSRGVRAATFAAVCVLLASTGHIVMSGRAVPGWTLLLAFAVTMTAAWVLAARERGLLAVTTATVAVQGLLHSVFSWAQSPVVAVPTASAPIPSAPTAADHALMGPMDHLAHGGMTHGAMGHGAMGHGVTGHEAMSHGLMGPGVTGHGLVAQAGTAVAETPAAHDMTDIASSSGMLSAHLLAALLSGLWMAYGERALFRLLRALPAALLRPRWFPALWALFAAVVPVPRDRFRLRPVRAGDERAPRRLLLAHSVISRGPPRAFAVH